MMSKHEPVATSAYGLSQDMEKANQMLKETIEYTAAKDAAVFKTAKETEAQTVTLNNQLLELKAQNEELRQNNQTLKELYEKYEKEAEDTKMLSKKDRKISRAALAVAIIFPVLSLVISIVLHFV